MEYTLIANTGIHMTTFPLEINSQEKYKMWFHEWYDTANGRWKLDLVHEYTTEDGLAYFKKYDLFEKGYLSQSNEEYELSALIADGLNPLKIDSENSEGVKGDIFKLAFSDKENKLGYFENVWLPIPYFFKRTEKKFKFGPLNWSRFKLVPRESDNGKKIYDVILAFDTRAGNESNDYNEYPVFPDQFSKEMEFGLCTNEFLLMDFCSAGENWSYIDKYLMKLVYPDLQGVSQIRGTYVHRMSYIASYVFLINYIAQRNLFPQVILYKGSDVETKDVDMVIDIGNSRTTALLIEDNTNFNQVYKLQLTDYTNPLTINNSEVSIRRHEEPFDMRLVFRKADFGMFGINDSKQFIHPSLIRLGQEANTLIHKATGDEDSMETLSTYSSPKRYLWDNKPTREEWRFLMLNHDKGDHILKINGITNQLKSDGQIDLSGQSGTTYHYSRRSLMTFSFLEMLVQARTQINSDKYRIDRGKKYQPRRIKRIIVTCPTAMSKIERESLVKCAKDAIILLQNFEKTAETALSAIPVEVIPSAPSPDQNGKWYYDEATCSQLVYVYGEVGHKYKGNCGEFFSLYGKQQVNDSQPTITIGSLDIGAGTSDLMICKYSYKKGDITTITPEPLFYDSFYYAGDDMLHALIKSVMILDEKSAFRRKLHHLSPEEYRQKMKNFVGPDYNGQTMRERVLRRDFNIQYSLPLMCHFLELLNRGSRNCIVRYNDVFVDCTPNEQILDYFKEKLGFELESVEWGFDKEHISEIVTKEFEPLLKKIAAMMFACSCDVVILSGRPASLPPIREIFLKYYTVSPDRLILLNNYYVGDWYPFGKNTGYIADPKTIVAMGAVLGYYASALSNLNKFVIDTGKLSENLRSTVNYIEATREGQPVEYFISPDNHSGKLTVSAIPINLKVRQLGVDSYPSRELYTIDFNKSRIASKILKDNGQLSDAQVYEKVKNEIDILKERMPFKVEIERESDEKEALSISSIEDKEGKSVINGTIEIHIQSLGVDGNYWLDFGAFDF